MAETLGEIIKAYRAKAKISQTKFAKECGLSKAYVAILENNIRPDTKQPPVPSLEVVLKVAQCIGEDSFSIMQQIGLDIREKEKKFSLPGANKREEIEPFRHIVLTKDNLLSAIDERRLLILPFPVPTRSAIMYVPSKQYGMPIAVTITEARGGIFAAYAEVLGGFTFNLYDINKKVFWSREDALATLEPKKD